MSEQFIQATNRKTGFKSMMHNISKPSKLFTELAKKNHHTGETMSDWEFTILTPNGKVIQREYNWRKIRVTVTLGDLYR